MKRKQRLLGPGTINKLDKEIKEQQIRRSQLMHMLHNEFGIPWGRLWDKCEARLQDMLRLEQTYNTKDLVFTTSTDRVIRGV